MSSRSIYSTALLKDGELTANYIADCLGKDITIVDACANVGGNTQWFSRKFKTVLACEINPNDFKRLVNNMNLYDYKNIIFYNKSCLDVLNVEKYDCIFFDPPWGGKEYKFVKNLGLSLDSISMTDIIQKYLPRTKCIVYKHPTNAVLPDKNKIKTVHFIVSYTGVEKILYVLSFYSLFPLDVSRIPSNVYI